MSSESENSPRGHTSGLSSSSPPARARREGNDSLWKRARRTLGTQNLAFLQTPARPTGAASSGPTAPNKRREQVRHAQRTHRQRTQNYIKTLESEVVRLRESESNLLAKRDELTNTVRILKSTIASANIPLPAGIPQDVEPTSIPPSQSPYDMAATVSYGPDDLDHQRLHVSWPEIPEQGLVSAFNQQHLGDSQAYADTSWSSEKPLPNIPTDLSFDTPAASGARSPSRQAAVASPKIQRSPPDAVDTLDTAIDFVLTLEHPCMAHIPYPAEPGGEDPANHMMLASTSLVAQAPSKPQEYPNTQWKVTGGIIKDLLNLSRSINLEGEITPVEAWHILSRHPNFQRIGKQGVETLKWQLAGHVRCEGFGAVLDEPVFWFYFNELNESLPPPPRQYL